MEYSRETLVAKLRELGITYLAPSDAIATELIPTHGDLLRALVHQDDSRLKLALIPLFIRHPEFAEIVPDLVTQLESENMLDLQTYYMTAVYLQRLWKTRIGFYLDNRQLLPDLYSQQLALPPADERFGKNGLYDLTDQWKERSLFPFDRLAAVNNTVDLFFEQLALESSTECYASAS